jgi:tetratricopeptide (TPR) repeat protein
MVSLQGKVEARRASTNIWEPARLNDAYCAGDRIKVGERSRADLAFPSQPIIRLDQNSTLTLAGMREERTVLVELLQGAMHFFSRLPRSLEVNTSFVTAGVRGTEGLIRVDDNSTQIIVFEGEVVAANSLGSVSLTDGQSAVAERRQAPVMRAVVRPRDAVQWALYYPPVIYLRPEEFGKGVSQSLRDSIASYQQGNYSRALELLPETPEAASPRFSTYRAALLLAVGRVDEAARDLEHALRTNAQYAEALALQALIAVVQNDKQKALSLASDAVASDSKSSAALIALSYARQANFDLNGALEATRQSVAVDPDNALAWARLAELHMSLAQMPDALLAAKRAVVLNPELSRTQTVLGFAYLTRVDIKAAKQAFAEAIERDQADPLPRLGLGLAIVRAGDLEEGRRQIEIAVSLDPGNPLARSYGGKAYYEEKRTPLAERQYAIAKELDPKDPTPWFYDAIAQETTNRPAEALQSLQKSIELNENRAVYRSRLLLDSDLAARSASLGRVYSDLGFEPLALVEGWKSVNTDPSNFSAHRLLADSYSSLPRHEIARVSDLLQSQLLQPVGLTPIQPRLAESNLFLISAGGPGAASFNEFNPLFTRNQVAVQANAFGGERGTIGGEAIVSGLYQNTSLSVSDFHYETDGWRQNADQNDNIADAFIQVEPVPGTGLQFEYRYRDLKTGDLQLNFFPENQRPALKNSARTETYRVGLRQDLSPASTLLVSVMTQDDRRFAHDMPDPVITIDINEPHTKAWSTEVQHLFRSSSFNTITGAGVYRVSRDQLTFSNTDVLSSLDAQDADVTHANVYLYSYLNLLRNVTFTVGASGDFFDSPGKLVSSGTIFGIPFGPTETQLSRSRDQFNPKLGVTWNPMPDTTVRAAAFRVLKRSLVSNQTIEPTQVAGFNQFFDDIEGTDAWRYGAALDQKLSRTLFGGVEVSRRDLRVPIVFTDLTAGTTSVETRSWRENIVRPYLFWTPHDRVALSAEYIYERFDRGTDAGFGLKVTTQKVPLSARVFHPSGFSLGVRGTFVDQSGDFQRNGTCCQSGSSKFWVFDAGISYRLPDRRGFVFVGATNLFNRNFLYQETDFNNPAFVPGRAAVARISLALP